VSALMLLGSALLLLTLGRYRRFGPMAAADILATAERTADQLPI
jgi:hypothetical protein